MKHAARWGGLLILALFLRLLFRNSLDLSDLPGAGSGHLLGIAVAQHNPTTPMEQLMVGLVELGMDPFTAGVMLSLVGGLAMVLGVSLAAEVLSGPLSGLAAGLMVCLWGPAIMNSLFIGADAIAIGLGLTGVGLTWLGALGSWKRYPLVIAGALLALIGSQFREIAAPLLPLVLICVALNFDPRRAIANVLPGIAAVGWTVTRFERSGFRNLGHEQVYSPSDALASILDLTGSSLGGDLMLQFLAAAVLSALIPGRHHVARLLMALACPALVLAAVARAGEATQLRHLHLLALPLLILVGSLAGLAWERLPGRWRALVPIVGLPWMLGLSFDALDHAQSFSKARVAFHGAVPTTLPPPPEGWKRRTMERWEVNGLSLPGGPDLLELAAVQKLAIPLLHDERHLFAVTVALRGGGKATVIEAQNCCEGEELTACGQLLAEELDGRLLLPVGDGKDRILDPALELALRRALGAPDRRTPWWDVWDRTGKGSTCNRRVRWKARSSLNIDERHELPSLAPQAQ